ncbi:hypothetical protein A8B73_21060 [Methylosinus sp. 3S-1]|nr:hypothetical protein A8B73_21060 [Methylosinus sp. 3S-1]
MATGKVRDVESRGTIALTAPVLIGAMGRKVDIGTTKTVAIVGTRTATFFQEVPICRRVISHLGRILLHSCL